jgi:hypothetical protein
MVDKLRLLIREIILNEVGTMGVTHPANVKKNKSDSGEENPEGDENNKEMPSQ